MDNIQYIMIDTGSESNKSMMSDIGRMDNGMQITNTYNVKNPFLHFLMKIHFSYFLNCKIILPGKRIWEKFFSLNSLLQDQNKEYYIIVVNNAIHKIDISTLNKLHEQKNVHVISLLLDSFDKLPRNVTKMIRKTDFDLIYSFQKSDCDKYGFKYTNQIYSKDILPESSQNVKNDVFFVGLAKNRIDDIYKVYTLLTSKRIKCRFIVIVSKYKIHKLRKKYQGLILQTKRISYNQVLKEIANTKCILEICQEGQDGLTMRFYEALFYNRKLITNNKMAEQHPCYRKEYMDVYDKIENIDIEKIKRLDSVDYGYKNEMSPVHFCEIIKKDINKIEMEN